MLNLLFFDHLSTKQGIFVLNSVHLDDTAIYFIILFSYAEDHGADPDHIGSIFNSNRIIIRHADGKFGKVLVQRWKT